MGIGNPEYALSEFKWTINGGVMEHPPLAAKINQEGGGTDSHKNKPSGLLINSDEDWPNGYQWYDTDKRTYNTLFTFAVDGINSVSAIQMNGYDSGYVPLHVIIILHNVSTNPTMETIVASGQYTKRYYSDTALFVDEVNKFTYDRVYLNQYYITCGSISIKY